MIDTQADPIKAVLEFDVGYLFACLPFLQEGGQNLAFSCVNMGDGWMGAANGPSLFIVEQEVFKGCNYLLSGRDIEQFYQGVIDLQDQDNDFMVDHFVLKIESASQAIAVVNHTEQFKIELMPYKRIDLKTVDIPRPDSVNLSGDLMPHFDPSLLTQFLDAVSLYCGKDINFLKLLPTGRYSPMYVEMGHKESNMHGVLMPTKDETKLDPGVNVTTVQ